jgi:hypothetical protein
VKTRSKNALITVVSFVLFLSKPVLPQDQQAQTARAYLSGQKLLVTYRQGGPVYGTYFLLQVHLCQSGSYMTFGQSRKQTVMGNEQVNNWRDQGRWNVSAFGGQLGIQYVSISGQANFVPILIAQDGSIWAGNGLSVVRQGRAQCS